ncbi:transcription factor RFX4-like, partial [Centruroides sculpturatus]
MDVGHDCEQKASRILRPHSTPATLMWLEENYEVAEGVCIPRSALYMHYVDFCAKNGMQPVNAASFGKIIRQQFPQLTTRRLGTRGQSRYHYYGIAVRESSLYFQLSYSKKGTGSNHDIQREVNKQIPLYSPRSRLGTVLPDFPTVKELNLPSSIDVEKITTFLMMYRTHCQRLLDTIIRGSFNEVQNFLLHFWQGIPSHLSPLFETNVLVNLIGVCDSILYKAISSVLLPTVLQTLPDSLTKLIRRFVQELDGWLKMALNNLPEGLKTIKLEMAKRFAQVLRRQMSLNHLTQASRMVVHNGDVISQMLHDWRQIDIDAICRETLYSMEQDQNGLTCQLIKKFSKEFESLLEEEGSMEAYVEWLEALVNKCILLPSSNASISVRRLASQFLLTWSAFGTRVIRDMTLHSAASFGSFHLLRLMFDDYVLFLVETIHIEEQVKEFLRNIANDMPPQIPDTYLAGAEYSQIPFGLDTSYNTREQYSNISTISNQEIP